MKVLCTLGVDLSQDWLDLYSHEGKSHLKVANTPAGFAQVLAWLKSQQLNPLEVMVGMEHTGLCSYGWEAFLHARHIPCTKVSALAIKRSLGLVRGKTDKIDAQRIARYGFEKRDVLCASAEPDAALQRLQILHTTRARLVRHRSALLCAVKQYQGVLAPVDPVLEAQQALITDFTRQVKTLEAEIQKVLQDSASLTKNSDLLKSVIGVGPVLSAATLIKTGNFTLFGSARKFSCYCGTAPFEHSSGKTIRRKTRVSQLADKGMKTLLDQAAKTAIQHDPELRAYYQRRLKMGKSKKSTLNIVRNKIIYRMFAVIKRGTPFQKDYPQAA